MTRWAHAGHIPRAGRGSPFQCLFHHLEGAPAHLNSSPIRNDACYWGQKDPTIRSVAARLRPLSPTFPVPLTVFQAAKNMVFYETLTQHAAPYQQKIQHPT